MNWRTNEHLSLSNSADLRSTSHLDTERRQSGVADSEPRQSQLAIGTATAAAAAGGIVRITAPIVQLPFLSLSPQPQLLANYRQITFFFGLRSSRLFSSSSGKCFHCHG